jgi:hypothetical protein
MKQTGLPFIVQDKKQLTALTSSARQEIVDVLPQMGTVSVGELAATPGQRTPSTTICACSSRPAWCFAPGIEAREYARKS